MLRNHQTHALQRRSLQTCRVTAHRKPAAYLRDRARRLASRAARRRGLMMRRRRGRTDATALPRAPLPPTRAPASQPPSHEIKLRDSTRPSPIFNQTHEHCFRKPLSTYFGGRWRLLDHLWHYWLLRLSAYYHFVEVGSYFVAYSASARGSLAVWQDYVSVPVFNNSQYFLVCKALRVPHYLLK